MRNKLNDVPGIRVFMVPAQDIRAGGRQSDSQYQFTLWSSDIDELQTWVPKVARPREDGAGRRRRDHRPRAGRASGATSTSTARPPRGSACASRTSTTRSTMPSRSGRSRRSTARATSIASSSRSMPSYQRDPNDLSRSTCRARAMRRCHYRRWRKVRARHRAAGGQPSGAIPIDDHHLQSRARHHDRAGDRGDHAGGRRACTCRT